LTVPLLTALYDACVLYPAPLRDLLMHLALTNLFRARWTDAIHDEWVRSVLESRPDLTREQLERTRRLMNAHVRDCLVTGYEDFIAMLALPDPDDRHVLAAAIHARVDVIVTYNLADFPAASLEPHGVEAQHPDDFVSALVERAPQTVCAAVQRQRTNLRNPPRSADQLLESFEAQALAKTVALLRRYVHLI
jgi:hypothetical protein